MAAVLSREFPSPKTALGQALRRALDRLHCQTVQSLHSIRVIDCSHSPAGSLVGNDVENAGNDRRVAGLHDDCKKLGFDTVDRGRMVDEEETRDTAWGTIRAKERIDNILKDWTRREGKKILINDLSRKKIDAPNLQTRPKF